MCIVFFSRSNSTEGAMHFHSTATASGCRSPRLPALLLILCCLTGVILAQTFQYSRGWTNGRKRGGPAPPMFIPSSASGAVLQNLDESSVISNPCSQLQRIRFLLGARNPQQVSGDLIHLLKFVP